MIGTRPGSRGLVAAAIAATVLLAAGSTIALAALGGGFGHRRDASVSPGAYPFGRAAGCTVPSLPGTTVDVTLTDMMAGGMMRGGMMSGGMAGGMMRVVATPASVAAGQVSFRVANSGGMVHELVVLPLADGQAVGTRAVGNDGRVDEAGSLGEASRTCGAGAGDGITPGGASWVTVDLGAGRYELVCNEPGHYAGGMHTLLTVASR